MRDPIRLTGTAVAVAILTLGLAPSAGAASTTADSADHATVATAPAGADAAARYWKCRWPSYRNAHPWLCRVHHGPSRRGDDDRDGGGGNRPHNEGSDQWRHGDGGWRDHAGTDPGGSDANQDDRNWTGEHNNGGMNPPQP